jgi:prephenate dehydrogenase
MNGLADQSAGSDYLSLAGPGFRDFTRIAASDPTVWRDVLLANRDEVLRQVGAFRGALQVLEEAIQQGDGAAIEAAVRRASATRKAWQDGPLR